MLSSGQSSKEHEVLRANADPPADCLNNFFFSALSKKNFSGGDVASLYWSLTGPWQQHGQHSDADRLRGCRGCVQSSGQLEIRSGPFAELEMLSVSSGSLPECE